MNILKKGVIVVILLLGLILRLHNYETYPQRGASSDEYSYSFLGVSLLTKGIPISWSAFPAYKNLEHLTINKIYFPIVYPYFDHPPLNGLLVGSFALLNNQDTFEKIELKTIRLVPIFLSFITMILVFLLTNKLYGYKTGAWALFIYATTTIVIMNSRVVFAENLLTPLFLEAVYLFVLFKNKLDYKKSILFGLLAGASFWTKELGIVVFFTLVFLFLHERIKLKYILVFFLVSILIMLGYVAYGIYYDKDVFFQILALQSEREIGPKTLSYLMSTPIIVNKIYYDGWYFLGLLSLFLTLFDFKKHKMIVIPTMSYFLLMIFSLTQEGEMGWYMIPLFPFMAIASAALFVEGITKQSWFVMLMMLFIGLYNIRYLFEANFGLAPIQFRTMMIILFLPFLISAVFRKERLFSFLSQFWFYFFILTNSIMSYTYIHPA